LFIWEGFYVAILRKRNHERQGDVSFVCTT
jgi:hypothetical protein